MASLFIAIPLGAIVCFCRHPLSTLFSSSEAVREALSKNLLVLGLGVTLMDSLHVGVILCLI